MTTTTDPLLHILLVEANAADARRLQEELMNSGAPWCTTTHVETLAAAMRRLATAGIDAVLLDQVLPDADGIEPISRIREVAPAVPVIVLTGFDDDRAALDAMREGAHDCLAKNHVHGPLLARAVRFAVERRRAEEAQRRETASAQAATLREQFVAVLGHDLRNPLSSIAMSTGLLLKGGDLSERQQKTLGRIAKSADRMNRMISDLLDFTRTRLGGGYVLSHRPTSLTDVCRQVIEELETVYPNRTVVLNAAGRTVGNWDADRMAQVASNLINNGLAYSPTDSAVRVTLTEDDAHAALQVHSQGSVIPAHLLAVMFEPFHRVQSDPAGGSGQGLGLGLYIAQQIVLAHQGTIGVTSTEAEGTTITAVLPRSAAPA